MKLLPLLLSSSIFFAQAPDNIPDKTPQQIEQELDAAEAQFNRALKMFNPWYTGPLLTPSASLMPQGAGNFQPYIIFQDTFASYNEDRKSVGLDHNVLTLLQPSTLQTGVTPSTDFILSWSEVVNWQDGHTGGGFGDIGTSYGFQILKQTRYIPAAKFTINQTFPTGKYRNLSTNGLGLNATGGGCYATQFQFAVSKLFLWDTAHPFNTRFFVGYKLSTTAHVRNFNAYGGGFGTRGKVRPGNTFSADIGLELSIDQNWVVTNDIVYQYSESTKFHGTPGTTTRDGHTPASTGKGFSDQLSLAPAFEYNWNENIGIIAGVQFTVYGRNSANFAAGQVSVSWSFP